MPAAATPANEAQRLQALYECDILDTPQEREFDDLTRLACRLMGTPVSIISLVDADRVWVKSACNADVKQLPRDTAPCPHVILQNEPLIIMDATRDPRLCDCPLVTGEPHVRAYAGVPLVTIDGLPVGVLSVMDFRVRGFSALDIEDLGCLARQAIANMQLRREVNALAKTQAAAEAALETLRRVA